MQLIEKLTDEINHSWNEMKSIHLNHPLHIRIDVNSKFPTCSVEYGYLTTSAMHIPKYKIAFWISPAI